MTPSNDVDRTDLRAALSHPDLHMDVVVESYSCCPPVGNGPVVNSITFGHGSPTHKKAVLSISKLNNVLFDIRPT